MKLMKALWYGSCITMIAATYFFNIIDTSLELFVIQVAIMMFTPLEAMFCLPLLYKFIPVNKRFTIVGLTYSISRVILFPAMSFGFIYVVGLLHHYALAAVILPMLLFYKTGLNYFEKLIEEEKAAKSESSMNSKI